MFTTLPLLSMHFVYFATVLIFLAALIVGWLLVWPKIKTSSMLQEYIKDHSDEGFLITNRNNRILFANEQLLKTTGYTFKEIKGKNPKILSSGNENAQFYKIMWHRLKTQGYFASKMWDKKKNGVLYYKHISFYAIKNRKNRIKYFVSVQRNLTDEDATSVHEGFNAPKQSTFLSHAFLTKLINKRIYDGTPFVLVMARILNQVSIKRRFGQAFYEQAFELYSELLTRLLKETDLIAEIDDETFAIASSEYTQDVETLIELLESTAKALPLENDTITFENKYGYTYFPADGNIGERLIVNANLSLQDVLQTSQKAKAYHSALRTYNETELKIQNRLHHAIENKHFILHYQPQIDKSTNTIIGLEALIRWNQEDMKHIGPGVFIPIAERYGYINPITELVLQMIAKDMPLIKKMNPQMRVAVNLSGSQFEDTTWFNSFKRIIKKQKLDPQSLEIELTESQIPSDLDLMEYLLNEYRALGVRVALDDFGVGYSSLSYIRKLSVDTIKIDQSFTVALTNDEVDITETIIQLSKDIGATALAEGVETQLQSERLIEYGCTVHQGYYYSEPMPLTDLIQNKNGVSK